MKKHNAGYSMMELVVAMGISVAVTGAAIAFASKETRLLGLTSNAIDMSDSSRAVIDMMGADLRHAGAGVGYRTDGTFGGLLLGTFTVNGVAFNSNNSRINLSTVTNMPTDDIGMLIADGGRSTIADYSFAGVAQSCRGTGLIAGQLAVLRSEDGLATRTVRINSLTPASCSLGQCVGGCDSLAWSAATGFESDTSSAMASYVGGQIAGGLKTVVWFVEATSNPGVGSLRRAVFDGTTTTCTARNGNCGELMSEYVESVQLQVWRWDTAVDGWVNASAGPLNGRADRLRADIEVVVRARVESDRVAAPVAFRLEAGQCAPNCNTRDQFERRVLRTSVDIRNSARMRLR